MLKHKRIPVILITGYLGSGKTTVLNYLLSQEKRRIALVVNDMGEINVDARLLADGNAKQLDVGMIELSNGCICCTLRDEFMTELDKLSKKKELEAIFVEASGVSDPASIAEAFLVYEESKKKSRIYLSSIATVVDVYRIYNEFLEDLESSIEKPDDDPDIINLVMDQIEFCNTIIMNKCDLLDEEQLDEVTRIIKQLQPEADMIYSVQGKVNIDKITSGRQFDYDKAMNSSLIQKALAKNETGDSLDDEYGITSFVFEDQRPFIRDAFIEYMEKDFPETIIRTKGYVWFEDDPIHVQLVETAGRNASVTEFSNWIAAFSEEERQDVLANYPEVKEEWDEVYGDRLNQIVFIGRNYDKEDIAGKLNKCLVGSDT